MKENPFYLYNAIELRCLISNSKIQKESQTSFLSVQYIMLCVKSTLLHYLLAWHSNLSLFLPVLMEITLKFYYPAHQISICFLLYPLPIFFLFFLPWDYACGKNFFYLTFQLHLVVHFIFWLYFFPLLNMYALWYSFYQSHMYCCYSLFLIICLYVIKCTMCSWQNICNY